MYPYKTADMIPNFAFALAKYAAAKIEEQLPHLQADFPAFGQFDFSIGFDDQIAIVTLAFKASGIPSGGTMDASEFARLKALAGANRSYASLNHSPDLIGKFGWDRLMVVLDVKDGAADWELAQEAVVDWLNNEPLPRANRQNLMRVQAAIPLPPQYSLSVVTAAMWVLECEETCVQGTAFDVHPYGVLTNHHVVAGTTSMLAFRAHEPARKLPIRVIKANAVIDLAQIEVIGATQPKPLIVEHGVVPPMAHVAVCGFPNFRVGDSGVLSPGLVVGTRPKSGVQRLLTNAPIVAGMSGGPAIGASGAVIGVCVTGAKNFSQAGETEDHSIIPISAMEILLVK